MSCRLLFEDDKHAVHLYNAVNDQILLLEEVTQGLKSALWDAADPSHFLLSDGKMLYTYVYMPTSLQGPSEYLPSSYLLCSAMQHKPKQLMSSPFGIAGRVRDFPSGREDESVRQPCPVHAASLACGSIPTMGV